MRCFREMTMQLQAFAILIQPFAQGGPFTDQCFMRHLRGIFPECDQPCLGQDVHHRPHFSGIFGM